MQNSNATASTFTFKGHQWSPQEGKATFTYIIHHNSEEFTFHEVLTFPVTGASKDIPQELLQNTLDNVLLALGMSYYKLFCPKEIVLQDIKLSREQADFWNTVYTKGLGEFFYQNKLDFHNLISFPVSDFGSSPVSFPRQDRCLVGIGGGKDSIVAGELLKAMHKDVTAFVVNTHPIKEQTIELLVVGSLVIKREIDPMLLELNKREDSYNGHVPFSTFMAFISLFTSLLYHYRYAIFANEESASYGNVTYLGEEINHQWSKSLEFEILFQEYVKRFITSDITYFSLLRPFSEIAISKRFTQYPQYFPVFSSCNKNFRIEEKTDKRWCGECPKCAFIFLMLAAFLPKEQVMGIFGQNLFTKESLLQTYKELLGVAAIKPFDCVGTPQEVTVAFSLAMQTHAYDNDMIMLFFKNEVLPKVEDSEALQKEVFALSEKHRIPKEFQEVLTQ